MALTAGTSLGPYQILAKLGEGGMGAVYRARDPRLGRDVAIKVVAGDGAQDPVRRARFEQEARAAAALNHPHILAVHDVGTADIDGVATPYVVSELLEGESLRDRIARGKVPPRAAIEIAAQIAKGLAAAHEHGIVHRDIKPENVWVTKDGAVKVLDFGLAKLREQPTANENGSTTLGGAPMGTGSGVVLGTVGYMAPEQVRGEVVDHRADLFALGCVLYELASGQRAFHAATAVETLSAILTTEPPDLTARVADAPGGLERIVRRCLAKDAGQRFQSARDLAFALETVGEARSSSAREETRGAASRGLARWRETTAWAFAASAVAMLGWRVADPPAQRSPAAATIIADVPMPSDVVMEGSLALSPDGTTIAFVGIQDGTPSLWRRRLDERDARLLEGTMGAAMPFWSPDGRVVAYFAGGKLRRVPADGGPSADICDVVGQPRGGTWSPSGAIVFAREGGAGLERVSSDGSNRRMLTHATDGERHEHPVALADGARVAFTVAKGGFGSGAAEAYVASLDGGPTRLLARDARRPTVAGAHLVFARGRALLSRPMEAAAGDASSERVLASDLADAGPERQPYGLSQGGALVYARQVAVAGLTRLTWLDRAGRVLRTVGEPGRWSNVELSPRGDRFVLTLVDPARDWPELWLLDAVTDRLSRLSVEPGRAARALWAPDGERVLYSFTPAGTATQSRLFVRPANGTSPPRVVVDRAFDVFPDGWSADGGSVLYASRNSGAGAGGIDLWKTTLEGGGPDVPIAQTRFDENGAHISPNDRWVAYVSNESGRREVYVAPFDGSAGRWHVSTGGGQTPRWRPDGRELFYLTLDGHLRAIDVDRDAAVFTAGRSSRLFNLNAGLTGGIPRYAFSADGQRLLAAVPVADSRASTSVGVITNWEALLATP